MDSTDNFGQSQQPQPQQQFNQFGGGQQAVPNNVGALVLGILTIFFCWCYIIPLPSIVMGIIAIILANQGEKLYKANPERYTVSSYKNMRAGKICAIVGLSIIGAYFVIFIAYLIIAGTALSMMPWGRF